MHLTKPCEYGNCHKCDNDYDCPCSCHIIEEED